MATGDQVAHVHVVGLEAGQVEGGRHFALAVDALLAQDGDAGALAHDGGRGRHVTPGLDGGGGQAHRQVGRLILGGTFQGEGLGRAGRVVAQAGDAVAGLGPGLLQRGARQAEQALAVVVDLDGVLVIGRADDV